MQCMKNKFFDKRVIIQSTCFTPEASLKKVTKSFGKYAREGRMFEKYFMQIYGPISCDECKVVANKKSLSP